MALAKTKEKPGFMSKILLIVGLSGSGKDYIAESEYKNFTLVKLNQPFKDQFEIDHKLAIDSCNDKSLRDQVLTTGPMSDYTIQEGMVQAYHQSIKNVGYGAKFRTLTILKTLETINSLSKCRTPVVITDLRKPIELRFLINFAELIRYDLELLQVRSNRAIRQTSDESLEVNIANYKLLTGNKVFTRINDYVI